MFTVTSHPLRAAISFFVIYPAAHSFNTVFTTASRFGRAFARFSSACLPTILFLLIGTFIFFPVYRNARMFFVTSPPHRAAIFAVIFRISVAAQSYHIFSLHCAEITFARFSSASIPAILWVSPTEATTATDLTGVVLAVPFSTPNSLLHTGTDNFTTHFCVNGLVLLPLRTMPVCDRGQLFRFAIDDHSHEVQVDFHRVKLLWKKIDEN